MITKKDCYFCLTYEGYKSSTLICDVPASLEDKKNAYCTNCMYYITESEADHIIRKEVGLI